jgi:hypothetical protein
MGIMTVPDVWSGQDRVVEVASPRTRLYGKNRKKDIYQGFGVPAYWIVEPDRMHTNRPPTSPATRSTARRSRSR